MATFHTIEGTAQEIDEELNKLDETNHVKIVSSNAFVKEREIVHTCTIYYKPRKIINENTDI